MGQRYLRTIALVLTGLLFLTGCGNGGMNMTLAVPAYPVMAPYPNEQEYMDPENGEWDGDGFSAAYTAWQQSRAAQREQPAGYTDGFADFTRQAAEIYLTGSTGNALLSPLNESIVRYTFRNVSCVASSASVLSQR